MVPLLLRLGSFGRTGFGAWMWSTDDPVDEESDQSGLVALCGLASPIMDYVADAADGARTGRSIKTVNGHAEGSSNREQATS
jgi:hypothetical protein